MQYLFLLTNTIIWKNNEKQINKTKEFGICTLNKTLNCKHSLVGRWGLFDKLMHNMVKHYKQGWRSLFSIGGDDLQFYPNFALFSILGGDKPRPRFFSGKWIRWRPKQKKVFTKIGRVFFFANSSEDQKIKNKKVFTRIGRVFFPEFKCCRPTSSDPHADQSQIIGGGDADVDQSQIIGGVESNYWGDISSIPPGFGTPDYKLFFSLKK